MGFPARACNKPTSVAVRKQSLGLAREVSLSKLCTKESVPGESGGDMKKSDFRPKKLPTQTHVSTFKGEKLRLQHRNILGQASEGIT